MNFDVSRRSLMIGVGALAMTTPAAFARTNARIAVIGGGFGGTTAARTARRLMPSADVTLIDPDHTYASCPFSNLYIAGERAFRDQQFFHGDLPPRGITHVKVRAKSVDGPSRTITLEGGETLGYDKLVLSPGIAMRWGAIEGYQPESSGSMPHAWQGGGDMQVLRMKLDALEDGQTVVISVPAAPYRCPPGPYERASLIAHYLKTRKPRSKLILLDAKNDFSKRELFQQAWAEHYPDHLEWRSAFDDGRVARVDVVSGTVETDFETHRPGLANIIPPQKAASIAERAGVADQTGWCPIDAITFESTLQPDIHVIGDAAIAAPMPKSAFSANLQGKVCAMQIARMLSGLAAEPTTLVNTCYSFTRPDEAISIVGAYSNAGGRFAQIPGAGGTTPLDASAEMRRAEARQAKDWFAAITAEAFG